MGVESVGNESTGASSFNHTLTIAAILIVALVGIRCLVPISPNEYWDSNPAQAGSADGHPARLSFDLAESAWLDVLSVLVAGAALLLGVRDGCRISRSTCVLASLGVAFCCVQMPTHIESLYKCSSWIAACTLGVAALHLAHRPQTRRWLIAGTVALVFPITMDALWFVMVDHPFMVDMFTVEKETAFLNARGWERGSPQHLKYLDRLNAPDVIGAFAFSNVLGSVMAALGMLALTMACGAFVARRQMNGWPWIMIVPGVLAVAALVTVLLTRSKGAAVAVLMIVALLGFILIARRRMVLCRWVAPLAFALIGVAMLVVIVRGLAGPPQTMEGERSLLFRYQYWGAAAKMITADASAALVGIPPGDFQERYAAAKDPLQPEEVASAHNVFIDQIAMLGLGGWAWTALMLFWLFQSGCHVRACVRPVSESNDKKERLTDADTSTSIWQIDGRFVLYACLLSAMVLGGQLIKRWAGVDDMRLLVWAAGLAGFLITTALLATASWTNTRWMQVGAFLAATLLLVHNQIEMTFHQPGSAPIAWLLLAVAAGPALMREKDALKASDESSEPGDVNQTAPRGLFRSTPGVALIVLGLAGAVFYAVPMTSQQRALATADHNLRSSRTSEASLLRAVKDLRVAEGALSIDPKPYVWQVRLHLNLAMAQDMTIKPTMPAARQQAIRDTVRDHLDASHETLDRAADAGLNSSTLLRLRADVYRASAAMLDTPDDLKQATVALRGAVRAKPYSWQVRMDLAELLWRRGRKKEAADQYVECLKLSEQAYLDQARQMPAHLIELAEKRIETVNSPADVIR